MPSLNRTNKEKGHLDHAEEHQETLVPVVVAGLNGTGKTTILSSLFGKTDSRDNQKETLGLTATTIEFEGSRLRLIDLGGKEPFRDLLWETYIKIAEGLVFVIDSTKTKSLKLARDWFWRMVDWGNKQAPILILINKWNDETTALGIDEITANFELERFSEVPARPIRILEITLSEQNVVRQSFGWLVDKLQTRVLSQTLEIRCISLYQQDGSPIIDSVFFGRYRGSNSLRNLIQNFEKLHFSKTAELGLQTLTIGEHRIALIKGDLISCGILVRKFDSQERAKAVTEAVIGYIEEEFIEKGKKLSIEAINEFMNRNFPHFLAV
ncbi:MAG: ADP-ribosylation factor-like protein [Candidatus Hodarchaeales archaeon]